MGVSLGTSVTVYELLPHPSTKYIENQLPNYWVVDNIHYIATMLHPNLKSFNHTPNKKQHTEALLKSEFNEHQQLKQRRLSLDNNNNNNKYKHIQIHEKQKTQLLSSVDDIFDMQTSPDEFQGDVRMKTEFDRYNEDETKIDKDMNVLIYWNNNKILHPTLFKIAQRVLSIPATNTSVERLFSDSGITITNRRSRLQTRKYSREDDNNYMLQDKLGDNTLENDDDKENDSDDN
ncbi:unnamed protein product [Rotaria sordida]|uniref:HAT C-terminal dimerisation domain-containing protein n=1 Tax=Rotaria sordida TaxID=392033 RepID=A0A819QBW0_9BILA|nr:unnamed protein product [Rotaria sordida]CAF1513215.1 unnamed protein product [Rotaria sordida]CAF4026910.1 unnamed protein product [Rotaria sordida]CAF4119678.1 unnamed protein product [Rotaria sordida]